MALIDLGDGKQSAPPAGQWYWLRLAVICSSLFVEGLAFSGGNVQIASIGETFGISGEQLQYVIIAFPLAYASFLLGSGLLCDRYGSRRMFVLGMSLFSASSLYASLAPNIEHLVIARFMQGAGSALSTPAAISLIASEFRLDQDRNRALGWFSTMGAVGFSLGVLVVGWITEEYGWRSSFAVFFLPSLVVAVLGRVALSKPSIGSANVVPWAAMACLCMALIALFYAIENLVNAKFLQAAIGAAIFLFCVGLNQLFPFFRLDIAKAVTRSREIQYSVITMGFGFASVIGAMFIVSLSAAEVGRNAFEVGLMFLAQGVIIAFLSPIIAERLDIRRSKYAALLGLLAIGTGNLLYIWSIHISFADVLVPGAAMIGVGVSFLYPAATIIVSSSASKSNQGVAAGVLTTGQQLGCSIGVAIAAAAYRLAGGSFVMGLGSCLGLILVGMALAICVLRFRILD